MKLRSIAALLISLMLLSSCASDKNQASFANAKRNFEQQHYQQAYEQLLVPAEKGNPQAQYALGYMYYYGKGTQMNHVLGKYWIRKAAIAGNENAAKAIQMILAQENSIMTPVNKSHSLMSKANGSQLATHDLKTNVHPVKKPLPLPHKTHKIAKHVVSKPHTTKSSDEAVILSRNSQHYTAQLLDASTMAYAQQFIKRYRLTDGAHVYRHHVNGKTLYVVIYGDYPTRAAAEAGVKQLAKPVQRLKPWLRRYRGIQTEIR